MMSDNGNHIGGLIGFLRSLGYIIKLIRPTRVIIIFDGKGGSQKRKKLFPDYKAGRAFKSKLKALDLTPKVPIDATFFLFNFSIW